MTAHFHSRAAVPQLHHRELKIPLFLLTEKTPCFAKQLLRRNYNSTVIRISRIKAANGGGGSYLDMWRKAVDREKKSVEFERMAEKNSVGDNDEKMGKEESGEESEKRNRNFEKLLEVSVEERDRVQRMQVIDRAAAAIAAARAILKENSRSPEEEVSGGHVEGTRNDTSFTPQPDTSGIGTPGPSFWAWAPPPLNDDEHHIFIKNETKRAQQASSSPSQTRVLEQERVLDILPIPFETSMLQNKNGPHLPPLQSLVEVEKTEEDEIGVQFSARSAEAANALSRVDEEALDEGFCPDGSRRWRETGIERRPDGVVCKWTLTRGVSVDNEVEWENKYWEAADEFGYKELGSEKCGRDAAGNVWREFWRESMMQKEGLLHLEKTADKWGKNIQGDEWQEKWWEHYDASGRAEKWAHKWCSIDPHTPLEAGHAHVWHERWGENFDGQGGCVKYTDKWAERFEGDGWAKWGDKWDENFDLGGHGVKQGETWWEGKYGDRWNRTWGEGHNGSGWVHKYGRSSSGEHWDTHVHQDTWYERFPHYGFYHCFENSVQLRDVDKPSEWS
ncbi:hypothetical protein PHJA_000749300 [Phtheirospermum japonicum]|uniref:Uncharacterized protein n=1 Tax=Phtheirospermum japonicum TaxID=374723 RepID=A0A830BNE3_9LAMI|nr:hypothetical protein PHJA_000749300 [Phtheirospermum japonicum]